MAVDQGSPEGGSCTSREENRQRRAQRGWDDGPSNADRTFKWPWQSQSSRQSGDAHGPRQPRFVRFVDGRPKQSRGAKDIAAGESIGPVLCKENRKGRVSTFCALEALDEASAGGSRKEVGIVVDERHLRDRRSVWSHFVSDFLLPQGYPDSVAPQYASYMFWRGFQYFFGGAISVYTTKSLISSVGVAGKRSGEAAAAINWVMKDGAGRAGRFLFAGFGKSLDSELKQFRLFGDLLMEVGAALELATASAPRAFLPLACTANLAKNVAAVAMSSTRAPIYRSFAQANNMADITAKGESVANLADLAGTVTGILLSRTGLNTITTFCLLSAGYLFASRKEVDSVELPYYNHARLAFCARNFLTQGVVPGPADANRNEPLVPWADFGQARVRLGASVAEAFDDPAEFRSTASAFSAYPFVITFNERRRRSCVLLKEGVDAKDVARAAFHAHVLLHALHSRAFGAEATKRCRVPVRADAAKANTQLPSTRDREADRRAQVAGDADASLVLSPAFWRRLLPGDWFGGDQGGYDVDVRFHADEIKACTDYTRRMLESGKLYEAFLAQSAKVGWRTQNTALPPTDVRLCV